MTTQERREGCFEMQDNYEYLKDTSGPPFRFEVIAGNTVTFSSISLNWEFLFQDLRVIEDNYRLLKKLNVLLTDLNTNDLSDVELKIGLGSCAYTIVQSICRLLEKPKGHYLKRTNCIYTRIHHDIECVVTQQIAFNQRENLVNQPWYEKLKWMRDKRISHQEGKLYQEGNFFNDYLVPLIGESLTKPQLIPDIINRIKELMEFSASASVNGGQIRYSSRKNP